MSPLRVYTHTNIKRCSYTRNYIFCHLTELRKAPCHLYVHIHTLISKLRQTSHSQNWDRQLMSPLRVYTHTNSNVRSYMRNYMFCLLTESKQTTHVTSTCVLIAQLYIPSFHRFETDNSCHLYVCIHTLTSNLAQLYICRFTELKQTPLCVHTHTNIKRCSCLCNYIFCHLTESSLTTHVTSLCAAI
jgi:hypothetical protein